jgi:hypothetical protein
MRINTPAIGVQPAVTDSGAPRWRKVAGSAILGLGFVLGAMIALLYEVLVCTSPPPDWSQMHLRTFVNAYVIAPIVLFCGTVWLCSWLARCIDPNRPPD